MPHNRDNRWSGRSGRGSSRLRISIPAFRCGFTLLEVLVVIAVIALLIAILIPSLQAARERTRKVVCASQLHQLALAWHNYLSANADRFPRGNTVDVTYGGQQSTDPYYQGPRPLNRYLKLDPVIKAGAEVFRCPSDDGSPDIVPSFFAYLGTSYHMNRYLAGPTSFYVYGDDPCKPVMDKLKELLPTLRRGPGMAGIESKLILMGDMGWIEALTYCEEKMLSFHRRPFWFNFAFMDGHAGYTQIRKGMHVTRDYTDIPVTALQSEAARLQRLVE
ncbi:MAG: type II secretion system protein [Phycisphaerae bacterium]|nr:type II secretion system protein [Phycisphaerae bacterium]